MVGRFLFLIAVLMAGALAVPAPLQAKPILQQDAQRSCDIANVTIGGSNSSQCELHIGENDSGGVGDSISLFGDTWDYFAKVDLPGGDDSKTPGSQGGYDSDLLDLTVGWNGDRKAGTWGVDSWQNVISAVVVVKASNEFVAYLVDIAFGIGGTWSTADLLNGGGKQPGLSHLTIWAQTGPPTEAPLPAAVWFMLTALGGLTGARWLGKGRAAAQA
jgi:hypothetical protein